MKIDAPAQIERIGGTNAAMLFPRRTSPSVVGVASNGSRLFSIFSPTTLYAAIEDGSMAAKTTKKKVSESRPSGRVEEFPAATWFWMMLEKLTVRRRGTMTMYAKMLLFLLSTLSSFAAIVNAVSGFILAAP